jgi:ACS family pantothenate transporter-like MFS transporter
VSTSLPVRPPFSLSSIALTLTLLAILPYLRTAWGFALLSDGPFRGRRWPLIAFTTVRPLPFPFPSSPSPTPSFALLQVFNACICIALAEIPLYKHLKAHFFLYYMTQVGASSLLFLLSTSSELTTSLMLVGGGMSGLLFSWASEACSTNNEERSLVIALMNNLVRSPPLLPFSSPSSLPSFSAHASL